MTEEEVLWHQAIQSIEWYYNEIDIPAPGGVIWDTEQWDASFRIGDVIFNGNLVFYRRDHDYEGNIEAEAPGPKTLGFKDFTLPRSTSWEDAKKELVDRMYRLALEITTKQN